VDPIQRQIEDIGAWRLLRKVALLVGAFALVLVTAADMDNRYDRAALAFFCAGVVLGFVVSYLAPRARKVVAVAFVSVPVLLSLWLFVGRTLLGGSHKLPLRMVVAPLAFAAGFLAPQFRISRRVH
jgi:uncharacterized membrane protein (UPF0136 family)